MLIKLTSSLKKNKFGFVEIISRLIIWCTLPICAIFLSPKDYGEVIIIYAFLVIVSAIIIFGQGRAVLKFSKKGNDYNLFIPLTICTVFAIILILTSVIINVNYIELIIASYFSSCIVIITNMSRANHEIEFFTFLRLGSAVLRIIIVSLLVVLFSKNFYIYYELFCSIIVFIIGLIVYGKKNTNSIKIDRENLVKSLTFGLPLLIQSVFLVTAQHIDKILVAKFLGTEELGSYALMFSFCSSVSFLFAYFSQKFEIKIYQSDSFMMAKRYAIKFKKVCLKSCVIFYFISLTAYYTFTSLINSEYEFFLIEMSILYISQCLNIWVLEASYLFSHLNKNSAIMISSGCSAIVSLIVIYILVSKYGVLGVAISLVISSLINIVVLRIQLMKCRSEYNEFD